MLKNIKNHQNQTKTPKTTENHLKNTSRYFLGKTQCHSFNESFTTYAFQLNFKTIAKIYCSWTSLEFHDKC